MKRLFFVVVASVSILLSGRTCFAGFITARDEAGQFSQTQVFSETLLSLGNKFGATPNQIGATGTVSNTGWSLVITDTYHGMPLVLSYTGTTTTVDSDTIRTAFTGTGSIGSVGISAFGSQTFFLAEDQQSWDDTITIGLGSDPRFFIPTITSLAKALYCVIWINHGPVYSGGYDVTAVKGSPFAKLDMSSEAFTSDTDLFAAHVDSFEGTDLTGQISHRVVPEPGTLTLLGSGVLTLLGYAWWRRWLALALVK